MREATEGAHRRDKQHITPRQEEEVDRRVVQPGGTGLQPWAWVAVWGHGAAAWLKRGCSLGCMGLQPSCGPRGSASSKYERFVRVAARCHSRAPAAVACSGGTSGASAAASHEWLCGGAARSLSAQRLWWGR